jgi:pimeloyl-ACP methyl ester carboxylesterase
MCRRKKVPAPDIVLFGRSLGTALATDLAVKVPCRSLILESAFTNSQDLARQMAPFLFDWSVNKTAAAARPRTC